MHGHDSVGGCSYITGDGRGEWLYSRTSLRAAISWLAARQGGLPVWRLELLREAVAHVRRLALMANVDSPDTGFSERTTARVNASLRFT
jgi:hypothetical protein